MIPSIEPSEVGVTGLLWLFLSYGYVLYYASNMIGEGSELLLLVPSMAGLVGGVVLPLCRVVPDGMIILFSGLGDIETAQEMLSIGVGALAGSTIMLLTVPLTLSVMAGRVDLDADGNPAYLKKPKLSYGENLCQGLTKSGVAINEVVRHGSIIHDDTVFFNSSPHHFHSWSERRSGVQRKMVGSIRVSRVPHWSRGVHATAIEEFARRRRSRKTHGGGSQIAAKG